MFKIRDEATESALCAGMILALLWGIGISVRGFLLQPGTISWSSWFIQLTAGMVLSMVVPPLLVRITDWLTTRVGALRRRTARPQQI
ncbi:MAG TPA: hypothetical protein VJ885_14720 [Thermoanaerobaculia bacterium]|nr:hypothetical protein [Thermoanaerobaculia bacterium]